MESSVERSRVMKVIDALPELASDMEIALVHLGRGDLVKQLKEVLLERWTYDDFTDTVYLYLGSSPTPVDRLSLYDEVGVNLDTDDRGRLCGMEILEGGRVTAQLANAPV